MHDIKTHITSTEIANHVSTLSFKQQATAIFDMKDVVPNITTLWALAGNRSVHESP